MMAWKIKVKSTLQSVTYTTESTVAMVEIISRKQFWSACTTFSPEWVDNPSQVSPQRFVLVVLTARVSQGGPCLLTPFKNFPVFPFFHIYLHVFPALFTCPLHPPPPHPKGKMLSQILMFAGLKHSIQSLALTDMFLCSQWYFAFVPLFPSWNWPCSQNPWETLNRLPVAMVRGYLKINLD